MAIVTFYNSTKEQVGNTSSAMAVAIQMAIQHNIKILFLTTSLNDKIIKESFIADPKKNKLSFLMIKDNSEIDRTGIEGLDRVLRSNKISPKDITNYTKVILTNRLEILTGFEGDERQFEILQRGFLPIIELANRYYDMVIVDLDKSIEQKYITEILTKSDIVVHMISQRVKQIEEAKKKMDELQVNKDKIIYAIGKYMSDTKYDAKNIARIVFKTKDSVSVIPYNNLFFESTQDATVIDLFLSFIKIREKNLNYRFVKEVSNISELILETINLIQMKRGL